MYERHRHRYEVNNLLRKRLQSAGLRVSGTSPDERLVEVVELDDHPFFVARNFTRSSSRALSDRRRCSGASSRRRLRESDVPAEGDGALAGRS